MHRVGNISFFLTVCLRELSHGHFSDDNQKRLTGPNTSIPIYEAKMTSDSRLVVGSFATYRSVWILAEHGILTFSIKWIVSQNTKARCVT